jgi:hypothetical protein
MRIIAFTGLAGSGKSAAAEWLVKECGFIRHSFAQPIKDMVAACWPMCTDKSAAYPELEGKTLRHTYQTLGTEWGRNHMGENLWANYLINSLEGGGRYVIDDLRYDNEALLLRKVGSAIIEIRREVGPAMSHSSEQGVAPALVDVTVHNDGTLADLHTKLRKLWA